MANHTPAAIIRMMHVAAYLGVGKSTPYTWLDPKSPQYDPTFPRPVKLGSRASGIPKSALDSWIEERCSASKINAA